MDNEYQIIMEELQELKDLIRELKKDINKRDNEIRELKKAILNNGEIIEDEKDNELSELIKSNDPKKCLEYALKHKDSDITDLEKIIIDSKDIEANYMFMTKIENCMFDKHLKVILDSKNPEYNYYVAFKFKLDNDTIKQIRKIIVDSKNVDYCYQFASDLEYIYDVDDVSNIDITDLEQVVLDSMDLDYYYRFSKKVKNADVGLFQEYLLEIAQAEDIKYIFDFGVDVKGADLKKCRERIVELYNLASTTEKKEIVEIVDKCETQKIKCLFRSTFGEPVLIQ